SKTAGLWRSCASRLCYRSEFAEANAYPRQSGQQNLPFLSVQHLSATESEPDCSLHRDYLTNSETRRHSCQASHLRHRQQGHIYRLRRPPEGPNLGPQPCPTPSLVG